MNFDRIDAGKIAETLERSDCGKLSRAPVEGPDNCHYRKRPDDIELEPGQVRDYAVKAMMQIRSNPNGKRRDRCKECSHETLGRPALPPTMMEGKKLFRVTGGLQVPGPNGVMQVVARDGLEPPTPAFSGLRSTN
jgi:hypothetical protein